jgi:hypothetical protein
MFSAIPANEMAETLRVLTGDNAENAARHFGKYSFDSGDVATAILWTNIAELLVPAVGLDAELCAPPVPLRMRQVLEAAAYAGARYEDVDSDTLIRETLPDLLKAEKETKTAEIHPFPERLQPVAAYTADRAEAHAEPLPLAA